MSGAKDGMAELPLTPDQFLTPEESAEVDKALLTARDRFSVRVALYSLRSLKQITQDTHIPIRDLEGQHIAQWIAQNPEMNPEGGLDAEFVGFLTQLIVSALNPLTLIAQDSGMAIEQLNAPQVVAWFEHQAKQAL